MQTRYKVTCVREMKKRNDDNKDKTINLLQTLTCRHVIKLHV